MSWFTSTLRTMIGGGPRASRPPRSANGASSFHLTWELPDRPASGAGLVEFSAVLEVVTPPSTEALYFWALQVDFADGRGTWGGGHTGLQWNKRYPEGAAVNWGGYASAERGGAVLAGTHSSLPSFPDDPNTVAYPWVPGRLYRLRVSRSPDIRGAWRADVTDLWSGLSSPIRDLLSRSSRGEDSFLVRPVVWSEVFADCYAPSVTVRWTELEGRDETGAVVRPAAVRVNYQAWEAGGCPNTSVLVDESGGLLQVTNTERLVPQGARLSLHPGG